MWHTIVQFLHATIDAALIADRIYVGRDLPPDYRPEQGAAILLNTRGGTIRYDGIWQPSVVVRCYAHQDYTAFDAAQMLVDHCHDTRWHGVTAHCDTLPQLSAEDETGWPFVVSFWTWYLR